MKRNPSTIGIYIAEMMIRFYQKFISFDHGIWKRFFPYGYCRFYPTCSEYAALAIKRYGLVKGSYRALGRLLRCHPWNPGGHDPVK